MSRRLEDYSGNELDMVAFNSPAINGLSTTYEGDPNKFRSFGFDGSDDYINCGNFTSTNQTICGWIRCNNFSLDQDPMGKWEGATATFSWLLRVNTSGVLTFYTYNGTSTTSIAGPTLTVGQWHFICARIDSTTMYLNVDNGATQTAAVTGTLQQGTGPVCIGNSNANARPTVNSNNFDGDITRPMIFNRSLEPGEIINLYNKNLPKSYSQIPSSISNDCIMAYELSDNNNSLTDLSTAGNNGTANGGVTATGTQINFDHTVSGPVKNLYNTLALNGTSQYLQESTDSPLYDLGSDDFHISATVTFSSFPDVPGEPDLYRIIGEGEGSATSERTGWSFYYWHTNSTLHFAKNDGSFSGWGVTWNPVLDVKYQVTVERVGNDLDFYIDGVQIGTSQDVTAETFNRQEANGIYVGSFVYGGAPVTSYLDADMNNVIVASGSGYVGERYNGGDELQVWEYPSAFKDNFIVAYGLNTGIANVRRYEDYSGNELDITAFNSPTFVGELFDFANNPNRALTFDFAGTRYIDGGNDASIQIAGSISMSCWVYPSANGMVISKHNPVTANGGYLLNWGEFAANTFAVQLRASASTPFVQSSALTTGKWYHVGFTYDGTDLRMYVDGQPDGVTNFVGSLNANSLNNLNIGRNSDNGSTSFNGSIADVKIWGRALTAAEVLLDYNKNVIKDPVQLNESLYDGLRLHYAMTSADNTLTDLTGIGNDGTATNGAAADGQQLNVDSTTPYVPSAPLLMASASSQYGQASADLAAYDLGTADFHISADVLFNSFPVIPALPDRYRIIGEGRGATGIGPIETGWSFIYDHTNNVLMFAKYDDPTYTERNTAFTAVAGVKYQFTVERVGTDLNFYANGELLGTDDVTGLTYDRLEANGVYVGRYLYGAPETSYLDGEISNVFVVSSSGHVVERYNSGLGQKTWQMSKAFQDDLVGAWHLTTAVDADIRYTDFSDNENDMTLFGSPAYTGTDNYVDDSQFDANTFSGLQWWMEALDGVVDKSDNTQTVNNPNSITTVGDEQAGHPAFDLNGTNQAFNVAYNASLYNYFNSGGLTWFAVVKPDTAAGWRSLINQDDASGQFDKIMWGTVQAAGTWDLHTNNTSAQNSFVSAGTSISTTDYKVYAVTMRQSDMLVNHYLQDADDGTNNQSTPNIPQPTQPVYFGWAGEGSSYLDGKALMFGVFNKRMTPTQVVVFLRKLISKYGL